MKSRFISRVFLCLLLISAFYLSAAIQPSHAATVYWTDWTDAATGAPGSASGTITFPGSSDPITVSYSGEVIGANTNGGTNYWTYPSTYTGGEVDNAPPDSDIIRLDGGGTLVNTLSFSSPLTDPVMAILSLGRYSAATTYNFNAPFDVLNYGQGYWGSGTLTELDGSILQGMEGHGIIQFLGTYTSISWTVPTAEYWHGFTAGAIPAPIPAAFLLFGSGLVALVSVSQFSIRK